MERERDETPSVTNLLFGRRRAMKGGRGVAPLPYVLLLLVLVAVIYIVMSILTGTIIPSLGTIFILVGLGAVVFWHNKIGVLTAIGFVLVGGLLLYLRFGAHVIGF